MITPAVPVLISRPLLPATIVPVIQSSKIQVEEPAIKETSNLRKYYQVNSLPDSFRQLFYHSFKNYNLSENYYQITPE